MWTTQLDLAPSTSGHSGTATGRSQGPGQSTVDPRTKTLQAQREKTVGLTQLLVVGDQRSALLVCCITLNHVTADKGLGTVCWVVLPHSAVLQAHSWL